MMKTNYYKPLMNPGIIKKYCILFLTFFVFNTYLNAQVPEKFNYQAIVRDQDGKILSDSLVSFRISILAGSFDGAPVYIETHTVTTNSIGLVTLEIGVGTVESGDFSIIDWGKYNYYMKVEMDKEGGTNYVEMGTTQLLSVPYALYAKDVENKDDADADPNNELISSATLNGTTLEISDAGGTRQVDLSPLATGSATDDQILSISGHQLSIENGNTVTLPDETEDADADSTNEIQDLQLTGNTLKITGNPSATSLDLSTYLDNTDNQTLSLSGTTLAIQKGNNVDLSGIGGGTDSQTLNLTGNTLGITNGNTVDLSKYLDNTDNQGLILSGDVLSIANGTGSINLANYRDDADADPVNEIQDLQLTGNTLKITGNGSATSIDLSTYLDNTDNQTLSLSGSTLYIQNGNNVDLSGIGGGTDSQTLSLTNNTLAISNGNSVDLSKYIDNVDNQDLSLSGATLSLTNDATPVDISVFDNSSLTLSGNLLSIKNGNSVNLSSFLDNTDSQALSLSGNTLNISGNSSTVDLSKYESKWSTISGGIGYSLGNVGIGATNPSQKLEVNGSIKGNSFIGDGSSLTNINYNQLTDRPNFTGWDQNASDDFSGNYNDLTNKPNLASILANGNSVGAYNLEMNSRDIINIDDIFMQSSSVLRMSNASEIQFQNGNGSYVGYLKGSDGGYSELHCVIDGTQMVWLDESDNWFMVINDHGSTGDLSVSGNVSAGGNVSVSGNLNVYGTKNFVIPYPLDPGKEIVYSCLEGNEAGVYVRGKANLENGMAIVDLPEHFSLVAADSSLSANITPAGECNGLYIEYITSKKLKIKELSDGTSNVTFYYVVYGIRKGYEDFQIIRDKEDF